MAKSIQEIKQEFEATDLKGRKELAKLYSQDSRKGVINLIGKVQKEEDALNKELLRLEKMKEFERKYGQYQAICGMDEAGRGPLAGPVVAGAVILPKECNILYLNDSKQVSASKRDELYEEIKEKAVAWAVGIVDWETIDEINILQATKEAMKQALGKLSVTPDILLIDALRLPDVSQKQVDIVKGDARSVSIAAASIMAKVTRDRIMQEYDKKYPEYGFAGHKGYGSQNHIEAIKKYGPCPIHRKTFIKNFI